MLAYRTGKWGLSPRDQSFCDILKPSHRAATQSCHGFNPSHSNGSSTVIKAFLFLHTNILPPVAISKDACAISNSSAYQAHQQTLRAMDHSDSDMPRSFAAEEEGTQFHQDSLFLHGTIPNKRIPLHFGIVILHCIVPSPG